MELASMHSKGDDCTGRMSTGSEKKQHNPQAHAPSRNHPAVPTPRTLRRSRLGCIASRGVHNQAGMPQVKKAAPKQIQRKASPPKRATTPRPIRQVANAISPGKGLDQWYGESPARAVDRNVFQRGRCESVSAAAPSVASNAQQGQIAPADHGSAHGSQSGCPSCHDPTAGPSRALYLPRGLLDPQDIPSYLNGSLAGE